MARCGLFIISWKIKQIKGLQLIPVEFAFCSCSAQSEVLSFLDQFFIKHISVHFYIQLSPNPDQFSCTCYWKKARTGKNFQLNSFIHCSTTNDVYMLKSLNLILRLTVDQWLLYVLQLLKMLKSIQVLLYIHTQNRFYFHWIIFCFCCEKTEWA